MSYLRTSRAGARLRWAGLFGLIAALSLCLTPGIADAKKKKDRVKVVSYNLYLGSDLGPAVAAAREGEGVAGAAGTAARLKAFDHFANEVGFVLKDVQANDFNVRAQTIAQQLKKNKVDLVGLQEAALWRIEIPTDGGGPPRGTFALVPLIDYIDVLLNALNQKARTKKECKAKGLKGNKCYRGYVLVGASNEADIEQLGDFDNDPGPNGIGGEGPAFNAATGFPPCANTGPAETNPGADDTGVFVGDPGPPNAFTPPVTDPATGEVVPFDWNGDSSSNTAQGGGPGTNCGADTLSGNFATDPGPFSYASDCPDNNPINGMSTGSDDKAGTTSSCLFHGIDGDARLTMRDVILARKGAGVKFSNVTGANYSPGSTLTLPIFGGAASVAFTRGWIAADVSVRGKRFHLVNTHLESESVGSIREDQAAELVAPGGPATALPTVLIGDLNSDPTREPTNLPDGDGSSKLAIDRLFAAGFRSVSGPAGTSGHGELLNDLGNVLGESRIDHILTNSPSITLGTTTVLDPIGGGGLWASDHGGVLSRLNVPGGKKR